MIITEDLENQLIRSGLLNRENIGFNLKWEHDELEVDLTPFKGKRVCSATGTYKQIMSLLGVDTCRVYSVTITDELDRNKLLRLNRLDVNRNRKLSTKIKYINYIPSTRLRYLFGVISPRMSPDMVEKIMTVFSSIILILERYNWLFELVCENAHKIVSLKITASITEEQLLTLIPKLVNTKKICIYSSEPSIIDALGKTNIKYIELHSNYLYADITPIITNPNIKRLTTRMECFYDKKAKITLLEFRHPSPHRYKKLLEICDANQQAEIENLMSNIKTPNDV